MGALERNRRHEATTVPVQSEMSKGIRDVLAERHRQIEEDGCSPEFEDAHDGAELAEAAACYALTAAAAAPEQIQIHWPWDGKWWKPADRRQALVIAGAFILAELDRVDREHGQSDAAVWKAVRDHTLHTTSR